LTGNIHSCENREEQQAEAKILEVEIMLLQIKIKNYKSIGGEIIFDLVAGSGSELKDHLFIEENNMKALPTIAIFGANASGKTNFIDAIYDMCHNIIDSHNYDENSTIHVTPYLFDQNLRSQPTEFEIFFSLNDGKEYKYGYKATTGHVLEEWLHVRKLSKNNTKWLHIFNRKDHEINCDERYKDLSSYCERINNKKLLLSYVGKFSPDPVFSEIYNWFSLLFLINVKTLNNDLQKMIDLCINLYSKDESRKDFLLKFIKEFDHSIEGINIKDERSNNGMMKRKVYTIHKDKEYPLDIESDGIKKLFVCCAIWYEHLKNKSGVFIADELDSQLHPLVTRRIVRMYNDEEHNEKRSQLIFTSHNLVIMDNQELRRDAIWFTKKNKNDFTELCSLAEVKVINGQEVRADLNYEKNYLAKNLKIGYSKENNPNN